MRCVFSALVLSSLVACAVHEAEPVFRATVFIGDRGISIPLPPPSLLDAPKQDVNVDGEVQGLEAGGDALVVQIADDVGGAQVEVPLDDDDTFHAKGLALDLTDNCVELWVEDADGNQGERQFYTAVIAEDGETISVQEGCD